MKNRNLILPIILCMLAIFLSRKGFAQNIGINATGAIPDPSALLDLKSNNKGFLITRVDTANIPSPAFGLMTLSPTDSCLYLFNGNNWIGLGGVGTNCKCNNDSSSSTPTFPCGGTVIPIVDVINPTTGKIWMDRNLGASQAATSSTDTLAYGDLYQWGRCSDGHEKRTSLTDTNNATTAIPNLGNVWDGKFITESNIPIDWLIPQNNNLWQGVNGTNNPCPSGYRLPTEAELDAERLSWTTNDAAGAFGSPLKLTVAGYRANVSAMLYNVGSYGHYWSSTAIGGAGAGILSFYSLFAYIGSTGRAAGYSVRCIKN